ncbi:peptidoglycan-binding protein [Rubellimicrobium sp. CFH 75288]|uniref:peptidoglycan-binding domain-containing protein n=1 Tax=Rubellimicrobium sp. CFH 75288 TaxID=2697034 RepID=UPI001411DC0E|nr:peptidoglycan-binding protein [Rubellimicrobium sp. CFH 75288]NAZ37231.1 peptidoglycan-binding protein [Rubellimicrobium sp. CFH 75288]
MRRLALAAFALWPFGAWAENLALVIGTEDYVSLPDLPRGAEIAEAVDGIVALGFDVTVLEDARAGEVAGALAAFLEEAPEAERLLVALSGRFVTDGERSWYLTREAPAPGLMTLDPRAVSVESLLQVLARAPSRAVLLLGVEASASAAFDPWLSEGLGRIEAPQGVTVLVGSPRDAAEFLADEMARPRADLSRLVTENGAIRPEGYLPRGFVFAPSAPAPRPQALQADENALWQGASSLDTVAAYENYLRAYPQGRYAAQARAAIESIRAEPFRAERLAEEGLGLTAEARRTIQRNLTLLGFDPRGIDGIFGPGTRRAVTDWQQQNGFAQTGYLTAEQIGRIEAQAARRAAQLEAEAERQRQAVEAADRSYWEETGARGDEAGLRAYLERYPDGLFARNAEDRLARIEEDKRRQAEAADRTAWDSARGADTIRAYQGYLESFPRGLFATEARARIATLEADRSEVRAQGRAAEEALGLNALTARVVEQRLAALGLDPGAVDGRFDPDTRRALRNFQRDRGLPVSGFLDEATLVRILADTLQRALQD